MSEGCNENKKGGGGGEVTGDLVYAGERVFSNCSKMRLYQPLSLSHFYTEGASQSKMQSLTKKSDNGKDFRFFRQIKSPVLESKRNLIY